MLKNDLYTINSLEEEAENQYTVKIVLDKDHNIFKGHFPEKPILPGVCQIEIIAELLEEIFGVAFMLKSSSQVKFQALVDPTENVALNLSIKIEALNENQKKVLVTTTLNDETVSFKLNGVYAPFEE